MSTILRTMRNPGLYFGVLLTILLVTLAYQVRPSYDIVFGTATDGPLLTGFNAGEQTQGANPFTFRWTGPHASILLRDIGSQDLDVTLSMAAPRPGQSVQPVVHLSTAGRHLLDTSLPADVKDYSFHIARSDVQDGSLRLDIDTETFSPTGDPRKLGIIVTQLKVAPATSASGFIVPPGDMLPAITIASALLGLLFALLGWGAGGTAIAGSSVGLLAGWLLATNRLWLTTGGWYKEWITALVAAAAFMLLSGLAAYLLMRLAGVRPRRVEWRLLLSLVMLVFAVRLAGQLHPQIFIVDLIFHAHRFETVRSGQLLFTIKSAEWGGNETFYLPTAYIFMLPLQWLLNNELLVIKLFTVAISTLGALPVFFIARLALAGGRAGLIAAALYLVLPMSVLPFSWGITTNLFGEFFALLALAVLVGAYPSLSPVRPALWLLVVSLLMALLSHPGVVQLTGVAFALIILLWLLPGSKMAGRRAALWTLSGLAAATVVAYLGYYSHFAAQMIDTFRQMQAQRASAPGGLSLKVGGSVADKSLGLIVQTVNSRSAWFFGGLRGFWQEAQAYYRVWPVVGSALGFVFIAPAGRLATLPGALRRLLLARAALAWWLTVFLFLVVGWVVNLYVRYSLFALPVVALGSGVLLSATWRRGSSGRWLAVLMLLFFAVEGLALWQYRITYAFK